MTEMKRTFGEFVEAGDYDTRKMFTEAVMVWQAEQKFPKQMKVVQNSGCSVDVCCSDDECNMFVRGRGARNGGIWRVDKEDYCETHSVNSGLLSPKTFATLFRDDPTLLSSSSDIKSKLKYFRSQHNCSVSTNCVTADVSEKMRVGMTRARTMAKEMNLKCCEKKLQQMDSLLEVYQLRNTGSFTDIEFYDDGSLRRLCIVTQSAVSVWKSGFCGRFLSDDGGFWKEERGKKYKLIVIVGTTGNNTNQTLVWAICDGETSDNIAYTIAALRSAGIIINSCDVAIIADEGTGLRKAFNEVCIDSFILLCSKHWLDGSKGWGKEGKYFYPIILAKTKASFDKAVADAVQHNCGNAVDKLMAVEPKASLIRYYRLLG